MVGQADYIKRLGIFSQNEPVKCKKQDHMKVELNGFHLNCHSDTRQARRNKFYSEGAQGLVACVDGPSF